MLVIFLISAALGSLNYWEDKDFFSEIGHSLYLAAIDLTLELPA